MTLRLMRGGLNGLLPGPATERREVDESGSDLVAASARRTGDALLLVALLSFVALSLWMLRAQLDLSIGDQSQYLLHARALLEGRRYTENGYIYNPHIALSPQAYPPGLPLLIVAVEAVGAPLLVARVLLIVASVIFLYLSGRYLARHGDPLLGPVAILICAFIPPLALFASGLYSDFVFAAMVWSCCLLVDRSGRWGVGRIAALSAVGAIAIAFRTIGVALIPALVAYTAWRAWRHREPWAHALVPVVIWLTTHLAIDRSLPVTQGYALQIASGGSDVAVTPGPTAMATLFLGRVADYRDFVSGLQLTPTPWYLVNVGYHVVALLAMGVGAIVWLRRAGMPFLFWFVLFYVGGFMMMPWAVARFLWPLAPMIWFATLDGVRVGLMAVNIPPLRARRASVGAGIAVLLIAAVAGKPPDAFVGVGDVTEGRALYAALQREAAVAPVRTLFFNPRDIARLDGVAAMYVPRMMPESLLAEADAYKITHAVAGSMGQDSTSDRYLRDALTAHPGRFRRVYGNEQFTLFRLVPEGTHVVQENGVRPRTE
ncbi:MAG: hypothetical protein ABI601_16780 [bacterium]